MRWAVLVLPGLVKLPVKAAMQRLPRGLRQRHHDTAKLLRHIRTHSEFDHAETLVLAFPGNRAASPSNRPPCHPGTFQLAHGRPAKTVLIRS